MVSTACHYAEPGTEKNADVNVVMLVHLSPAPNSVATSGCTTLHQISQGCTRLHHCLSSSGGASMIDKMDFDIKNWAKAWLFVPVIVV